MSTLKNVELAESALTDLEEILGWYAEQGVAEVGRRLVREILQQLERLSSLPESGRIVPELGITTVRELIHPPFRIVYRLGDTTLWVLRVWRSERLLKLPN